MIDGKYIRFVCAWICLLLFGLFLSVCSAETDVLGGFFPGTNGAEFPGYQIVAEQDDLGDKLLFDDDFDLSEGGMPADSGSNAVADPLEPVNRLFFEFNDKLYYWVLKPTATVYSKVLANDIRKCIRNFFNNLLAPVRVVNNLLQGKFKGSGIELTRFAVNTTLGVVGLGDAAKDFSLVPAEEDLGQTLGVYGLGEGVYICWPFLGPSNVRDTLGKVGDSFLDPLSYVAGNWAVAGGMHGVKYMNSVSLSLGDYELFTDTALDPYIAVRNAYIQYRRGVIKDQPGRQKKDNAFPIYKNAENVNDGGKSNANRIQSEPAWLIIRGADGFGRKTSLNMPSFSGGILSYPGFVKERSRLFFNEMVAIVPIS